MNKIYLGFCTVLMLIGSAITAQAQTIDGEVYEIHDKKKYPLVGATVLTIEEDGGAPKGVIVDSTGNFTLEITKHSVAIRVRYVSYETDTVSIEPGKSFYDIEMKQSANVLDATRIRLRRKTYGISTLEPKTTIHLREREFQKAACCNLSESFENAPAIDVAFTDAVTGTKQIKMLGLDGVYTSITREFMPSVRGLNSYYGLSFIPASWVEGIQITKGAGSVVNGFESMTGQINIEMKKPFGHDNFMLDQFVSGSGRTETDLMVRKDINQYVATSVFGRFSARPFEMDRNDDGFMDNPTGTQYQFMNRWQFYTPKGFEGQLNAAYNKDVKQAGQLGNDALYRVNIDNEQFDVWGKLGKSFKGKPYKSFGSQYAFNTISSQTTYGNDTDRKLLKTRGETAYVNLMYQSIFGNTNHTYKAGVSGISDWVEEGYDTFQFDRTEHTFGGFMEYTWKPDTSLIIVSGLRLDHSSMFGWFHTHRVHLKKALRNGKTHIRLSVGNGRRTANFFAQNQSLLISSRSVFVNKRAGETRGQIQEISENAGISIQHKFKFIYFPTELQLDYYRTEFSNELLVNRENRNVLILGSLKNGTVANSAQVQWDLNPMRRTEIRLAYRMFDVTTVYNEDRKSKPYIAKHRGFVNITQRTRKNWQFSSTLQIYGPQRIPGDYSRLMGPINLGNSPTFTLWNAQVSKETKKSFEFYAGVENILNRRQPNPILGASDPFGPNFDATMVWGPIFGRMFYGGFRYRLKHKNEKD